MSNLSELSIQLRKLQTEKNSQANEIDRLERQLRILSELKGISINDLHEALKGACEAEAHGELQALVGKLQARVEGLELGGGNVSGRRRGNGGGFDDASHIPTQQQFDQEAAARARTTLELRIGELEEVEGTLRSELDALYKNSQRLTGRNTALETQLVQQRAQLEQWELRWKAKEEEEARRSSMVPMPMPSSGSYNYSEFATTNNDASASQSQPILLHNAPQAEVDAEHKQKLLVTETALAGEKEQRSLVQYQLTSAQKSYELKIDQSKHRIQFLEEQLHDLEQQLSSLYAAFGMMQDDSREERNQRDAWRQTVVDSDAAVANSLEKERKGQPTSNLLSGHKSTHKTERSNRSLKKLLSPQPSLPKAAVKPAAHHPIAKGLLLLLLDKDGQPLPPNTPSTPRQKSSSRKLNLKLKKSASSRRNSSSSASAFNFTRQYCVLHGANGLYQIRYGDSYHGPVAGVLEFLTAGVSSIDHTPRSSSQSFGFEIMINAQVMDAPVLCCAAEVEEDFMMWMSALTSVIDGSFEDGQARTTAAAMTLGVAPAQG